MSNTVKVEIRVQGRCPSCGLETLYVDERFAGRDRKALIACSVLGCPQWDVIETLNRIAEQLQADLTDALYGKDG